MALSSELRRLYIAREADVAGDTAQSSLKLRATTAGVETIVLSPDWRLLMMIFTSSVSTLCGQR